MCVFRRNEWNLDYSHQNSLYSKIKIFMCYEVSPSCLKKLYETLCIPISPLWFFCDLCTTHGTSTFTIKPNSNTILTKYMLKKNEMKRKWIAFWFFSHLQSSCFNNLLHQFVFFLFFCFKFYCEKFSTVCV